MLSSPVIRKPTEGSTVITTAMGFTIPERTAGQQSRCSFLRSQTAACQSMTSECPSTTLESEYLIRPAQVKIGCVVSAC